MVYIFSLFFLEKYDLVGRLLKNGEEPTSYSDEEDDNQNESNASSKSTNDGEKPKEEWPKTLQISSAFYAKKIWNVIKIIII